MAMDTFPQQTGFNFNEPPAFDASVGDNLQFGNAATASTSFTQGSLQLPPGTAKKPIALSFGIYGLMTTLQPTDGVSQQQGQGGQGESGRSSLRYGLTEFKMEHFADQSYMRNFIMSSVETFTRAKQEYVAASPDPINADGLQKLSRNYRAILLDLVQSLQPIDEEAAAVFTHLDLVWYFCEIMFFTSHPELPILPYLMSWLHLNFDSGEEILNELSPFLPDLQQDGNGTSLVPLAESENLQKLWSIIYLYTFHGRTADAALLLPYTNVTNSKTYDEQLKLMQELLRKKPIFTPLSHSISEFESSWNLWHDECESRLNQKVFHGNTQLVFLAKIISGNQDGFDEAKDFINSWIEYLVMMLNYQYPFVRPSMLKGFARKSIDEYGDFGLKLKPIEEVLLSAMDYDIVAVLKEMQIHFKHPWFALHFSDLMFYGGMFLPNAMEVEIDFLSLGAIRDDLLEDYGSSLMQHSSLWEVGVKYLETMSNRQGLPIIAQLLRKRKPETEMEAEKLIQAAEQFGFADEAQGICKELAFAALKNGRIQQALVWSIRSTDVPLTTNIVEKIIMDDDASDTLDILPVLQIFLPRLHNCGERVLFLKGFLEFRYHLSENNYEAAIVDLCHMIHDNLIPKRLARKVLGYLHRFSTIGFKFRQEEITTLTEYIHTRVGKEILPEEEFKNLNKILLMNRAHCLLMTFRNVNKEKEPPGIKN